MSVILQMNGQVHFSSIKVLDFHVKVVLFYIRKFGGHLQSGRPGRSRNYPQLQVLQEEDI